MFRRLLFLIILAGIGFGIYTGINKAMDAFHTPKDSVSQVLSGAAIETGSVSSVKINPSLSTENTTRTPGFFSRTRTTIKGWFGSDEVATSGIIVIPTLSTGILFSGSNLSGILLTGVTTSETDIDKLQALTENNDSSGDIVDIDKPDIVPSSTTGAIKNSPTTTTKTTVTIPKKVSTPKKTTNSDVDPILDALFK